MKVKKLQSRCCGFCHARVRLIEVICVVVVELNSWLQSLIISLLNADMNDYKRAKQWVNIIKILLEEK
ncbi:unnamed protein product [Trifolium pratense]|uniref:Uncharacterized protein n=1 Tax=Trifolium pratense TaxID=57577 RepID=A0ACB0KFS7_TRIPR|nr:unnamed protein product [Trifolium pratense]